jgi:nicotinate phosphoribosyltransferase
MRAPSWPARPSPALLTDLYELTMMQAYLEEGMTDRAVFDLFVRELPARRNFLLACGLDDALRFLETVAFDQAALEYLDSLRLFSTTFLDYLSRFRFTGDVHAMPEGTPVFPFEPLLEVVAPLPEAQLVETFLINQVGAQTLFASKGARVVAAARGRRVLDFGFRRTHGIDAGLAAARAFYVAGIDATSNVAAGQIFGVPLGGTMAHSYIQAHDQELDAFRRFAELYPETTLLVDTYDTLAGVRLVVTLARELGDRFRVRAVRLDSGDLGALAAASRAILDDAGLTGVRIVASNRLDEDAIDALVEAGAPIDAFGVGTDLAVSRDAPTLDIVYKLVSYAGTDRLKLSPGKRVLPGRKQVFRQERDGVADRDVIACAGEAIEGRPLLVDVMRGGARMPGGGDTLQAARARAAADVARLPDPLRRLDRADPPYRADLSPQLEAHYREAAHVHDRPGA